MSENKEKNILIVSDFVYPYYAGGVSRHVYDVFNFLLKFNHPVKLITRKKDWLSPYTINDKTFKKDINKYENRLDISFFDLFSIKKIKKILIILKHSEKIIFHFPVLGLFLMILAKFMGKRVIYFFHGPFDLEYKNKFRKNYWKLGLIIRFFLQLIAVRFSDIVLYHSEYMKTKLMRFKPKKSKIRYCPPYVDHTKFNLIPPKIDLHKILGLKKSVKLIITTRRLTHRTGVLKFIQVYEKIRERINFETILIVGGIGEQFDEIKSLESNYIKVLGWINEIELADHIKSSDIYVLPSLELEGFGYVVLEALASGIPVIASDTSGGGREFLKNLDEKLIFNFKENNVLKTLNYALIKSETKKYKKKLNNFTSSYSLENLCKEYQKI